MLNKYLPKFLRGRIILSLLLCFASGIIIVYYLPLPLLAAGIMALLVTLGSCLLFCKTRVWTAFLPMALILGILFCAGETTALDQWDFSNKQTIELVGRVQKVEQNEGNWRAEVKVESANHKAMHGVKIQIYADIATDEAMPLPGAKIKAIGTVFEPEPYANANAFDYNEYLKKEGIAGAVSTQFTGKLIVLEQGKNIYLGRITEWLRDGFDQAARGLSDRQKALIYGVFLGDKSGLDYNMKNALGLTGALDAFAVSGLHVGYLVAFALLLSGGLNRRTRFLRFIISLLLLMIYCGLTDAPASVLRASLMAVCLLAAGLFDEKNDPLTTLSLAAFICLIVHPLWLFSAGFQLSFAAVLGIVGGVPVFAKLFAFMPKILREFLSVTFAATIMILPFISYYFYHISWLGWLLSPIVMLATGITVILSFVAVVVAIFSPWLAGIFVEAAAYAIEPVYLLNETASHWPLMASITGAVPGWTVAVFFLALFLLPWLLKKYGKIICALFLIMIIAVFSIFAPRSVLPQHSLSGAVTEIVFVDVGQGDCSLIITPDHKTILIDGGGSLYSPGSVGEYSLLPYLKSRGITKIDLMINSHPHDDHVDGLFSVLSYHKVETLAYADIWQGDPLQEQLLTMAEDNGAELLACTAGDVLQVGSYVTISFYHPAASYAFDIADNDESNDASLVCEVSVGAIDILYTGDIGGELLSYLCREQEVEAEIMKIPHHGSNTGYAEDLADILASEIAIFSVGKDNSYGHPTAKVVEYWQEYGEIYRTDIDGAISIFTNGTEYQIFTYYLR